MLTSGDWPIHSWECIKNTQRRERKQNTSRNTVHGSITRKAQGGHSRVNTHATHSCVSSLAQQEEADTCPCLFLHAYVPVRTKLGCAHLPPSPAPATLSLDCESRGTQGGGFICTLTPLFGEISRLRSRVPPSCRAAEEAGMGPGTPPDWLLLLSPRPTSLDTWCHFPLPSAVGSRPLETFDPTAAGMSALGDRASSEAGNELLCGL